MHLTLFFTRGNSLGTWHSAGTLEREILLYKALQQRGMHISFVTYGTSDEMQFFPNLSGIEVLYNRWNLAPPVYELLLPWLHAQTLKRADLFKTNQMKGAHVALIAGRLWKKPVVVRMGYLWSKNLSKTGLSVGKARLARYYEDIVIKRSKGVIVTTQAIKGEIASRISKAKNKIHIVPNYVETNTFYPYPNRLPANKIVFVGRLSEEKNLLSLIEAIRAENITLEIIGSGPQEPELRAFVLRTGAKVIFKGPLPNEMLPGELNQAKIFLLPSLYEGHPKALLEAMSCGLAVIGADVEGIRNVISHGETGWLCQPNAESIRAAIQHLLSHPDLCQELGRNARKFILDHFSLDQIADQEFSIYQHITAPDGQLG
jgi:glycosyltransferase involved in cell wall biosynthesis